MSTLRAATIANLAGTGPATLTGQTAAKAWVGFNGSGTVAINGSANTSSITDNGVGDYSQNFAAALTDGNAAGVATSGTNGCWNSIAALNTNQFRTNCINMGPGGGTYTYVDQIVVCYVVMR